MSGVCFIFLVLQLFEFGDEFRGKYDSSIGGAKGYYTSVSGYMDELLWAAMWLYKATDNPHFLNYVIDNAISFGGITWPITEFSWDVKYAGLQIMASMVISFSLDNQYGGNTHFFFFLGLGVERREFQIEKDEEII